MQTEISIHLHEAAPEKAMVQSADVARVWSETRLARFALSLCNELELKSDTLAGFEKDDEQSAISYGIGDLICVLRDNLADMRRHAIDEAGAGFEDDDFRERLETETPTVSEALAKARKEASAEPILSPRHGNGGIWL